MGIRTWEELQDTEIHPHDLWIAWKIMDHLRRSLLNDNVYFETRGEHHHILTKMMVDLYGTKYVIWDGLSEKNKFINDIGLAFHELFILLDGEFAEYESKWVKFGDSE